MTSAVQPADAVRYPDTSGSEKFVTDYHLIDLTATTNVHTVASTVGNVVRSSAADITLPDTLYVGGVAVIANGVTGSVTSGTGWSYDTGTATLYLTDGADIRYTGTDTNYLKNGIYCQEGTLNIHASGTVNITGYSSGIDLPSGSLNLYVEEGANVTISGSYSRSYGIKSTVDTNVVALSGKGTVNAYGAQSDGSYTSGIYAAGDIWIDGVTLNAKAARTSQILPVITS